ncbi:MAG: phosphonate C-P lyase system protein PhnH [Desulfoprunum sp.]|uniref:phosphonate C-P lyase system protein PhnH n=1 Tax=Desulfoprunum sp. TaxID=2020866 RepID=UPI003C749D2A
MDPTTVIRHHSTFRVLLQAMSHPGRVYRLPDVVGTRQSAVEVLGSLVDHEVGVAVIGDPELAGLVGGRTGCRPTAPADADYLVIGPSAGGDHLAGCRRGSLECPDRGATVVYLVNELEEGRGEIMLSGPGVDGTARLRIQGLPIDAVHRLMAANSEFPLGVDAVFVDDNGCVACIPRSSRIKVA